MQVSTTHIIDANANTYWYKLQLVYNSLQLTHCLLQLRNSNVRSGAQAKCIAPVVGKHTPLQQCRLNCRCIRAAQHQKPSQLVQRHIKVQRDATRLWWEQKYGSVVDYHNLAPCKPNSTNARRITPSWCWYSERSAVGVMPCCSKKSNTAAARYQDTGSTVDPTKR